MKYMYGHDQIYEIVVLALKQVLYESRSAGIVNAALLTN